MPSLQRDKPSTGVSRLRSPGKSEERRFASYPTRLQSILNHSWGPRLRQAIAHKMSTYNHVPCNADDNVTVTCGTTEGMIASLLALLKPTEKVVIFEPFYENYGPDAILSGAKCKYVPLEDPGFKIEEEKLKEAFSRKTKAVIINTPHNPTGRVFTRHELELIR